MRRVHRAIPFIALLLLPYGNSMAQGLPRETSATKAHQALLWRIGTEPASYVFGTIHFTDPRVLDLDEVVRDAISQSDAIYTEIPMDPGTMFRASTRMLLPADEGLKDHLPQATYERAQQYVAEQGLHISFFSRMQPWAFTMTLTFLDMLEEMSNGVALDQWIYDEGVRQKKLVGGLETVEEQIGALSSLSSSENAQLLEQILDMLEAQEDNETSFSQQMIDIYLQGDAEAIFDFTLQPEIRDNPIASRYFDELLQKRNVRMVRRMLQHFEEHPDRSYFFAVGAAHLGGPEGILRQLQDAGLSIERPKSTWQDED